MKRILLSALLTLTLLAFLVPGVAVAETDEWHDGDDHYYKYDFSDDTVGQEPTWWSWVISQKQSGASATVTTKSSCASATAQIMGCTYLRSDFADDNSIIQGYAFTKTSQFPQQTGPYEAIARVSSPGSAGQGTLATEMQPVGSNPPFTGIADLTAMTHKHGCGTYGYYYNANVFDPWVPAGNGNALCTSANHNANTGAWFWVRIARHGGDNYACSATDLWASTGQHGHGPWICQSHEASGDVDGWIGVWQKQADYVRHVDMLSVAYGPHCGDGECAAHSAPGNITP